MSDPIPEHAFARLFKAAREAEPPSTDQVFALVAVATGTLSAAQVEEARAEQERQREAGGAVEPLGQILLRLGHLSSAQYREILKLGPAARQEAAPLAAGASVGPFRILGELGRGGMGIVYRALDPALGREVALKVLRFSGEASMAERLQREARATARLSHPHIVGLHEAGRAGEIHYLAMELVEGESLSRAMPSLDLPSRALVLEKVARAVHYAHAQGVVHRDLKPGNILLRRDGEPVVTDFGLARSLEDEASLTATGGVLGTPLYMAPEQVEGRRAEVGPLTDVYALGVILYEMLAGHPPFRGENFAEVATRISREDPVSPSLEDPAAPRELSAVCLKALEKVPSRRYASAEALAEDLARWREGRPVAARVPGPFGRLRRRLARNRRFVAVAAGAFLLVAGAGGFFLSRWLELRREAERERADLREREAALREAGALWIRVLLARKDLYQAQTDPAQTRARIEEALGALDAYVARHPRQPEGWYVRARARLVLQDLRGAEKDLGRAVGIHPGFFPAWALLGRTLLEHGAIRLFHGERRSAALLLEEAVYALRQAEGGRAAGARPEPWDVPSEEEEIAQVLSRALAARYVRNDIRAARDLLEEALRRKPSEEYWIWLGTWEGDPQRQIACYDRALQLMPHSARAFLDRGTAKARLGDLRGAAEDYGRAVAINPGFAVARYNLAVVRRLAGDFAEAFREAARAVEADPDDAAAWALRGLLRYDLGDFEAALADLSRAIDLDPRDPVARNHRGMARHRKGDRAGARLDYGVSVELDPEYAEAHHNRGLLALEEGELPAAIESFSQAIKLKPAFSAAYAARAQARERSGDRAGAEADRRRAQERP